MGNKSNPNFNTPNLDKAVERINRLKYCQGTKCHEYRTKDRIRGTKGQNKRNEVLFKLEEEVNSITRQRNFCSLNCQTDWINQNIEQCFKSFR